MKRSTDINSEKPTFGFSSIIGFRVFPPDESNLHQRTFKVYLSSGNKYIVTIERYPTCTCPDNDFRGKSCKHINFILENVLHDSFPKSYFNNKTLDKLFSRLPGYIIHDCE